MENLITVFNHEDGFQMFFTDAFDDDTFEPSEEELPKIALAANEVCDYLNKRFSKDCEVNLRDGKDIWVDTEGLFDDETAYLWGCDDDARKLIAKHDINWES